MRLSIIFTFIIGLIMAGCNAKASNAEVKVVSPEVFQSKLLEDSTAYLLDVRKPDEYAAGHLMGAHLLDWLDTDSFKHDAEKIDKTKTIYVYCRSGRRSNEAARYLAEKGYPYHYGETNLTPIVGAFKDNSEIEIRIRELQ